MRKLVATLTLLFTLLPAGAMAAQAESTPAPDFTVPGRDGSTIKLSDLRGKVVYLDFWASWCVPCRASFPWMNEMHDRYADQGLVVLAVNVDQESDLAQRFIEANGPKFTIGFDPEGKVAEQYQVQGMPSSYIIDREGNIVARHMGFREKDRRALERTISGLLGKQ